MNIKLILNAALFLTTLILGTVSATAQQTFPYANVFTSEGLPNMAGPWTLDTESETLHYTQLSGGGVVVGSGTEQVTGVIGTDFVISTWVTVNDVQGGGTAITAGFGALSGASGYDNYYLADWSLGGTGTGNVRILRLGGGSFPTASTGGNAGLPVLGETYELRLMGTYDGATLNMEFAVFDRLGNQVGTAATATDTAPLTGEFFGFRNRTGHSSHAMNLDYHGISVAAEPMPAPASVPALNLIQFSNLTPASGTTAHPAVAGLSLTVSTGAERTMNSADIALYLNDELVSAEEVTITGASPSFEVSYDGLETNLLYKATVMASDNESEDSVSWTFDTFDGSFAVATLKDTPLNQSSSDGLQGFLGVANAPPVEGSLVSLTNATSATSPSASVILGPDNSTYAVTWDLGTSDVISSRSLTGLDVWVNGSDPWRTGYDGEWAISNDGENFTVIPNSRFATDLTYTGNPVAGWPATNDGTGSGLFNLVRYKFEAGSVTDFRYLRFFSYGHDNLDESLLRQPRIVELDAFITSSGPHIADIIPGDRSSFHPVADGIQFTASTDGDNTIAPEDIELFLNGEAVLLAELEITGSPSAREVLFDNLESDRFYTARIAVSDEENQTTYTWTFDTFSETTSVVIEATDYNFNADVVEVCPAVSPTSGGDYFNNPVPSTYSADAFGYYPSDRSNAYVDRTGAPDVDFHTDAAHDEDLNLYRLCDPVGTAVTDDLLRPKFDAASMDFGFPVPDYELHRLQTNEWFNYTRDFPATETVYRVYLRAAVTNGTPSLRLDQVTSDPTMGDQTTLPVGDFLPGQTVGYGYIPLTDSFGDPVYLSLKDTKTFRLTAVNANNNIEVNYLLFAPAVSVPPQIANILPEPDTIIEPDSTLSFDVIGFIPTPQAGITVTINGGDVTGDLAITGDESLWAVSYDGLQPADDVHVEAANAEATAIREFSYPELTVVTAGDLLWSEAHTLVRANRAGGDVESSVTGFNRAIGIAVDAEAGHVYFADDHLTAGSIGRVNFDGTGRVDLITGRENPQYVAVTADRIFWTEYNSGLWSSDLTGGDIQNPIPLADQAIAGLALDEAAGKVYVASALETANLYRANLDGTGLEELAHVELFPATYGIALDAAEGVLYSTRYAPAPDGGVYAHNLDTGDLTAVYQARPFPLGIAVSEDGSQLYWAERNDPGQMATTGRIITAPAPGGGPVETLGEGLNSPFGIALVPFAEGDDFASWIATFGLEAGQTGPQDDADGDGITNLVEYALGGDPGVASRDIVPLAGLQTDSGQDYLTLATELNPDAVGVTVVVEVSSDLVNWFSGAEHTTVIDETSTELVVRDNEPIGGNARRFIRLRVVED